MSELREYVVNLRRAYEASRTKRAKYAIGLIRKFVARHMRIEEGKVKLSERLNELVWSRGMQKPPRRVHIEVERKDEFVYVRLKGEASSE